MAMTPEIRLTTELATVSLRMLLQKSLSRYLHIQGAKARFDREAVPLSSLQVSGELDYQYESAIAHALAATDALEAVTLAPQLAADLMAAFAEADQETSLVGAIATGLRVHATPPGLADPDGIACRTDRLAATLAASAAARSGRGGGNLGDAGPEGALAPVRSPPTLAAHGAAVGACSLPDLATTASRSSGD